MNIADKFRKVYNRFWGANEKREGYKELGMGKKADECTEEMRNALMDEMKSNPEFKETMNASIIRNSIKQGKTVFSLVGDKPDTWNVIANPYDDEVKSYLRETYGDKVTCIYNEKYK